MTATYDLLREDTHDPSRIIALLYGRASVDRKKRGRSIKDQFADGEAECAIREWPIGGRYADIDRSASRYAKKPREEWNQLVARVEKGPPPGKQYVIVYADAARSNRDLAVYIKIRELCERTNTLLCYGGRVYDMRIPADRDATAQDALQSERELNTIQYRNARTARLNAARGNPHGRRCFGYTRRYDADGHLIGQFPDPDDAPLVLEAFERIARRESLKSVSARFRKLGRGPVTYQGVRHLLKNKTYIGIRVHRGREFKATWEPIVPEPLFWRVQAILDDPSRLTHRDNKAAHLLTGIGRCGVCGGALRLVSPPGGTKAKSRHGIHRYGCRDNHCVTVGMDRLDAYVEEHLLTWLASPAADEAFRPREDDGEQERSRMLLRTLQSQLEEARKKAATIDPTTGLPQLSVASLAALEAQILPMIEAEECKLRAAMTSGDPLIDKLRSAQELEEFWEGLTLDQKRHVIRTVMRVTLNRAPKPGVGRVDANRVSVVFVGEPGFDDD